MNNKKILTFLFAALIFIILGFIILASKNKKDVSYNQKKIFFSTTPIFFYGNTCPHCAHVEKWMKENKIEEKINIIKKEVYNNKENAKELVIAAEKCGVPTNSVGVPFLFAEGKCFIGTPDVIDYLSKKLGIKK